MAIQTVNLTVPGGDTPRSANTKINANFSNTAHAANRLVGTEKGNVMEVGAFGLGSNVATSQVESSKTLLPTGFYYLAKDTGRMGGGSFAIEVNYVANSRSAFRISNAPYSNKFFVHGSELDSESGNYVIGVGKELYHTGNTTVVNGSIKPSSPVVKIHTDSLELNDDAEKMGVTLNKRGVGDYLLQNTTGLRNDGGWRIELPQDVNGNPYFAVAHVELENNDIEVKTYKRIFDMNTFMFVPDLDNPVDIKEGRSIAIRFNDLPQETPTNP